MTAKRHYFNRAYYPHEQHFGLVCPTCELGQLTLEQPIVSGETAMSVALANDPAMLEPEDYKEWRFAALLRCNNPGCAETSLFTGLKKLHTGGGPDICECPSCPHERGYHYYEQLYPKAVDPSPRIIEVPDSTPEEVVVLIARATREVWGDPGAALNTLRMVLELVTADYGISNVKAGGGFKPLEARLIELRPILSSDDSTHLMALKWLGNSGSHADEVVSQEDALIGFDLLELALAKFYDAGTAAAWRKTKADAEAIIAARGALGRVG